MEKSLIYTRTGDEGLTSLVGGARVRKTHPRLEAYGTVDELNAHLGALISLLPDMPEDKHLLQCVQHTLFTVGAYLATDPGQCRNHPVTPPLCEESIARLEAAIDRLDAALPRLAAFVLPGGCYAASVCHVCRTVCRRAERRIFALDDASSSPIDGKVKQYMNRLSDYLFILSRQLNNLSHTDEIIWDKSCR